ncbi:MAG: hypothetical protein SOT71_13710 [Romboutsia timonensis]|uniref:hypothetical protein n=1 Tax=Romboutsia timonensis TaxID=1776391 RepID=UPI002A757E06|nr:hypothetical protein [Romboutsia timonensis]MDY2883701.1 hypothetical protein [Romboutsia timonensis]
MKNIKFNKISDKICEVIFGPIAVITNICIAFVINSFFSDKGDGLWKPIKYLVDHRVYTTSILIVWIIMCFVKNSFDYKNEEVQNLKVDLDNKNRQIEKNVGVLEGKYGEFAESIKKDNINKVLKKAVQKRPMLEACHLYLYEYNRIRDNVDIKLKFLTGYEQEGVCINVLKQKYYSIDKNIFIKLDKLIKDFKDMPPEEFSTKVHELNNFIEGSKIDESIKYRLRNVIFGIVDTKYKDDEDEDNIGLIENGESEYSLRTGILGGILSHKKGAIYSYKGSKEKKKEEYTIQQQYF